MSLISHCANCAINENEFVTKIGFYTHKLENQGKIILFGIIFLKSIAQFAQKMLMIIVFAWAWLARVDFWFEKGAFRV